MSIMQDRYDAVYNFMKELTVLTARYKGAALREQIAPLLIQLSGKSNLFPAEEFAPRDGKLGGLYQLWRGLDGDLALYASAGKTGKKQPPHDHTTWAVIAGVFGEEHNVFFDRVDDGSVEGQGALKKVQELTVVPGNAATLSGDIFHTIEVVSDVDSLHLHLYGKALDTLKDRIYFRSEDGGKYSRFMAVPETYAPWIYGDTVYELLSSDKEFAILDVRENGIYTNGHIFHAASTPLSTFELRINDLLPSMHTQIILVDDNDGMAVRASRILHNKGYHNVAVLYGGQQAWAEAGYPVYSGVNVPSKAFGELVESHYQTPYVTPKELIKLQQNNDLLILDSRTFEEFQLMSIPGAKSCPGGELVARAYGHTGPIVVNCAGRTRSILGAQSLINAGHKNVWALENGIMGQSLAGFPVDSDKDTSLIERPVIEGACAVAHKLANNFGIKFLSLEEVRALMQEKRRVTYLFDVRDPSCSNIASLTGAVIAPGGQLIQQTDYYAPIQNARIVVFDTDGVQAPMTATWLHQMGWEVYVCVVDPSQLVLQSELTHKKDNTLAIPYTKVEEGMVIIDVGDSRIYRKAHLPGASWLTRSNLSEYAEKLDRNDVLLFTCPTGTISRLAAKDMNELGFNVYFLRDGTKNVEPENLTQSDPIFLCDVNDVWYRPYDRDTGVADAMREYLSWEVGLLDKIRDDSTVRFKLPMEA